MQNPFRRDTLQSRLAAARQELATFKAKQELALLEQEIAAVRRAELYKTATPSEKARLDVEREVMKDEVLRRFNSSTEERVKARRKLIRIPQDAVRYMTAAIQSTGESVSEHSVTVHAQESILEAINGTPYGFDLIAEYRQLLQIPTLIRELWPYKPTVIRTLPMLDFIRWICRVTYEEAPVFKGLVKGKVNYVCRGMKAKITSKEPDIDVKTDSNARQAQKYIDQFTDEQDYLAKRRERRRRMMIEGEAFLWLEDPKDIKVESPTACYVEPDFIRPSQKSSTNQEDPHISGGYGGQAGEDWSFGIHTPKHQYWKPLGYQIVWNDNDEQKVSVRDMVHTAVRERSNIKRCLPPAFCLVDDMIRLTLLRAALADASKFRAGIGGVIKYEDASHNAIRSYAETIASGSYRQMEEQPTVSPITADSYTNLIQLPPGRDFVKGPDYPDVNSLQAIYSWHLLAIAQAEQVPESMISGEAAGSSYASAVVSESSSVIEFEALQEQECAVDRKVLKRILQAYIDKDLLPKNFFEKYEISVEGEAMVARDAKSETETSILAIEAQLCSRQTAATQLGFDYQKEKPMIEEEKKQSLEEQKAELALGIGPVIPKGGKETQPLGSKEAGTSTTEPKEE